MIRNPSEPYSTPNGISRRQCIAAALGAVAAGPGVAAEAYPDRPVRLIVPYTAGGGADTAARALAEVMGRHLGKPVIVENRGGANAIVGSTVAARAVPDGYTLLYGTDANLVLNSYLYKKLPYDPDKDFTPIGLLAEVPQMIAISSTIQPRNFKEFIQYAQNNPGALNYSSPGRGGNGDLAAEMLMQAFNIKMTSVNFKGGNDALMATLAGTVQVYFGTTAIAIPHFKAGKLIPIAVVTLQRQPAIPDVPTVAESGAPGFESTLRVGLVGVAGTPPAIIATLNRALNLSLTDPGLRATLERDGFVPAKPNTPASYAAVNDNAKKIWGKLIRDKGISLDN